MTMKAVKEMNDVEIIKHARRLKACKVPFDHIGISLGITRSSVTLIFYGGNWAYSAEQLVSRIVIDRETKNLMDW